MGAGPDEALADRAAIARAPGLDADAVRAVRARWPEPGSVRRASATDIERAGVAPRAAAALAAPDPASLASDLAWLGAAPERTLIAAGDAAYPAPLAAIPDPPAALWVIGDPAALAAPQVAIVGARAATHAGRDAAFAFARALAAHGLAVTSGLAVGVDAAAHLGALAANGPTVAVFGTGPDRVYPAAHRELAARVACAGACVSEYPPDTAPLPANFPRRNRIISGLALGVLVVEAGRRSGALVTARCAAEQGREVFAMPGSIHNVLTRGCHRLIREGAKLVESIDDVLEELAVHLAAIVGAPRERLANVAVEPSKAPCDPLRAQLLEAIGFDPVTVDTVVERAGLTPEEVSSMLLSLELDGLVKPLPGGAYSRVDQRVRDEGKRP